MDKIDKPVTPSLARIKARAKAKSEVEDLSMGQALRLVSQAAGFDNYRAARLAKMPPQTADAAAPHQTAIASSVPPAAFTPCHWAVIGEYYWYLDIGERAPELWRRPQGGLAAERVSQLGIFQTQRRDVTRDENGQEVVTWSVARYGTSQRKPLAAWTDRQADSLLVHFGLPIVSGGYLPKQQQRSEQLFLCSRAFAALRHAIRTGRIRTDFGAWNYGLTNVWNLLVAIPDAVFVDMGAEVTTALFEKDDKGPCADFAGAWRRTSDLLEAAWPQLRFDQTQLQEQIAALLPRKLGQRMRAHLAAAATAETEYAR